MTVISIMSAGEMGAAIGAKLAGAGHQVRTCLAGRGGETRTRATEAGLQDVSTLADLVTEGCLFLSIVPPSLAEGLAAEVAAVAREKGVSFDYVDCNAIAPQTMQNVADAFDGTKATVIDAGIIGLPPVTHLPRLYVSGPESAALGVLDGVAVDIRPLGPELGKASAFKMSYAGVTKGVNALLTAAFLTADDNGFLDGFIDEMAASQSELWARAASNIPRLPADAGRWVREMEEIAACFDAAGAPGDFHTGAAKIMARLDASPFGHETRRTRDRGRDLRATVVGMRRG